MATPKPRDCFHDTIVHADSGGLVRALSGIKVVVYYANSDQLADIYADYDTMTVRENPVETAESGQVFFYADVGEYDISIEDPQQRITNTRFRWNAVNSSPGGLPLFTLAEDIRRQLTQVGEIIDWWRPSPSVPLPAGFLPCDGRPVPADEHDFVDALGNPLGVTVNLPDLRNMFVVGADVLKADGVASSYGDGSAAAGAQHPNAPGIGGTGGSNAAKDLRHTHQYAHSHKVPAIDHQHTGAAPDHIHGSAYSVGDHAHGNSTLYTSGHARGPAIDTSAQAPIGGANSTEQIAFLANTSAVAGGTTGPGGAQGVGGTSTGASALAFTTNGVVNVGALWAWTIAPAQGGQDTTTTDVSTWANSDGTAKPQDFRPKHVGLLKLMKVRRT